MNTQRNFVWGIKFGHKKYPQPLNPKSWHKYAIFPKYFFILIGAQILGLG